MKLDRPSTVLWRLVVCLAWLSLGFATSAQAGNIYFGLSRNGEQMEVINHGNASAFYPATLRLLADGRWEQLPHWPGQSQPAELPPSASMTLRWPAIPAAQQLPDDPFAAMMPVMVRFFDQAGTGFGQISFFNQPQPATTPLTVNYDKGWIRISPPRDKGRVRTTWLLWAQEEGIEPLRNPVAFRHEQPAARRIDWKGGETDLRLNLGAGQPSAMLLHQTAEGYELQVIPGGGEQGKQQRTIWLRSTPWFYRLASVAALLAVAAAAWHLIRRRRAGASP